MTKPHPLSRLVPLGAALLLGTTALPAFAVETAEPIRIITIDSADADFMAYAYGGVLEGFGYNVEYVRIDYAAQIPALETGDVDVSTAIWDSTGWDNLVDVVSTGKVLNFGSTGAAIEEGWWYPSYVEELCPGLPDWEALKTPACVEAFSTVETEPRGRFVDAPADWETDSQVRIDALGLDFEAISSGSPITMIATMKSAVDQREPVIGWGFVPNWFFEAVDGKFVKLPADEPGCYDDPAWGPNPDATMDCGFSKGFVWKLGSKGFTERAPQAARLLHIFQVDTADVSQATGRVENDGERIEDVAGEWVATHKDEWSGWMK